MNKCIFMLLTFALLSLTSGCAPYRQNIADDFRDTLKVKVGVGVGLYVDAKTTSFVNPGLGWGGYWLNVGLENRHTDFIHNDLNGTPFPIGMFPGALPEESLLTSMRMANVRLHQRSGTDDDECAIVGQLFDWSAMTKWDAYDVQKRSPHSIFTEHKPSFTEKPLGFELGIGLLFVNARLGIDPVEFIDLLFTACGLDLLKDNASGELSVGADAESRASQP